MLLFVQFSRGAHRAPALMNGVVLLKYFDVIDIVCKLWRRTVFANPTDCKIGWTIQSVCYIKSIFVIYPKIGFACFGFTTKTNGEHGSPLQLNNDFVVFICFIFIIMYVLLPAGEHSSSLQNSNNLHFT